jgi:hypothetical protein
VSYSEQDTFRQAQGYYLDKLRDRVRDRPGHARYLELALESTHAPDSLPPSCTEAVATAISEDLDWIRAPHVMRSPYPARYEGLRLMWARREARRQQALADPFIVFKFK